MSLTKILQLSRTLDPSDAARLSVGLIFRYCKEKGGDDPAGLLDLHCDRLKAAWWQGVGWHAHRPERDGVLDEEKMRATSRAAAVRHYVSHGMTQGDAEATADRILGDDSRPAGRPRSEDAP